MTSQTQHQASINISVRCTSTRLRGVCLPMVLLAALISIPGTATAWGERGHDLITRVAVQQLILISGDGSLTKPFVAREHMLSHLSNVPDIVWRADAMSEKERSLNGPTHYISLERAYEPVRPTQHHETQSENQLNSLNALHDTLKSYIAFKQAAERNGPLTDEEIGSAPWRVLQLYNSMVDSLEQVELAPTKQARVDAIDEALLYAGLMSHFVADLANPHHTTVNYDGQLTGQKGLHGYFESEVVTALPLGLIEEVYTTANRDLLDQTLFASLNSVELKNVEKHAPNNASELILALTLNSHKRLEELTRLDRTHALLKPGADTMTYATRKSPADTSAQFRAFTVERLALGASVLAQLWLNAWEQAGQPDMSDYHSYHYPVAPAFVKPDYLGG